MATFWKGIPSRTFMQRVGAGEAVGSIEGSAYCLSVTLEPGRTVEIQLDASEMARVVASWQADENIYYALQRLKQEILKRETQQWTQILRETSL